jgi:hypothetical protein
MLSEAPRESTMEELPLESAVGGHGFSRAVRAPKDPALAAEAFFAS